MTTTTTRASYQHKLPRSGVALINQDMAKLSPRTRFPALDQEKQRRESNVEKISSKISRKKNDTSNSNPVTSPPTSATGQRKRVGGAAKSKSSTPVTRTRDSSTPTTPGKVSTPTLVNVIRFQKRTPKSSTKSQLPQESPSPQLKDEEPSEPKQLARHTIELKSGNNFYLPKRKLIHKPLEPFTLFIDETNAVAKLVWLYLLESQMPFKKICIKSKEGEEASTTVPAYCKHCIFVDGDNSLGQPTAIIRHICNNYTNNLLMGGDASYISQGFSWLHWSVSVLHRDLYYLTRGELNRGHKKDNNDELLKSSLDSVSLYFDMLEKIFASRDYLLGSVAWFCDSAVALILEDASSLSLSAWPRLVEWLERVKDQPNWSVVTRL